MIQTVKGFGTVYKAEVDVLLELSCFFCDPMDVSNLISGSSAFSKTSLNIWKFIVNEAELDVFLEFPCFIHDPMNIGNLISGSSAFLNSTCTSGIFGSSTAEAKLEGF